MNAKAEVKPQYQVEYWPIGDIKPYWRNPRKNDKAIPRIIASLKEFGWQKPLLVDKYKVLIAGHVRLEAAKALGLKEVPVHVSEDLTPNQVQAYRIVDNSSAELSEWDESTLMDELESLTDFDPELLGFDIQDVTAQGDMALQEWDFSLVEDEFIVMVRGPLPIQDEVRHRLKGMENVTVEASHIIKTVK